MSRSGYHYDCDPLELGRWRGQVASAIRGKRGQAFLIDLLAALDEMPEKRLIADTLVMDGDVCAIGALGRARKIDMSGINAHDSNSVSNAFNIAEQLAREITYINDESFLYTYLPHENRSRPITPEERWQHVREWVASLIKSDLSLAEGEKQ